MSKKIASIVSEMFFLCVGVFFFVGTHSFAKSSTLYLSSALYPRLISGGMIMLALISLYRDLFGSLKNVKTLVPIQNKQSLLIVLGCFVLVAVLWAWLGLVYLWLGIALFAMQLLLNPDKISRKSLLKAAIFAAGFTLFIYLVFGLLFSIPL